jgi:leader peptidase (prepilin peptidase)/N-methyltransferase
MSPSHTADLAPYLLTWVALLGAALGSFAGVCVARLPREQSVVHPRSACDSCARPIAWFDNLPVVSYLLLRGRCRHCGASIGLRAWLLELLMAGVCAALFVRFGLSYSLLVWLPLSWALLVITYLDIDHFWVPDVLTYPGMVWALCTAMLPGRPGLAAALWGLLPAALLLATSWIFERITRKEALGLGDIKLLAMLGLALGPGQALALLLLASVQGAVLGTLVLLRGGHRAVQEGEGVAEAQLPEAAAVSEGTESDAPDDPDLWVPPVNAVPFGPFLSLAALQIVLLPDLFLGWHARLLGWCLQALPQTFS